MDVFTQIRHELRHTCDISAAVDCNAVIRSDLISRRPCLLQEEVSTGRDGTYDFPETDCATADSGAAEMNDLIFRRLSLPPEDDTAAGDYDTSAVGLDDLIFRRLSFLPEEFAGGVNPGADACDAMKIGDMIYRGTNLPPNEFSAGRNGDKWCDLWTEPSVCNRPVTGSHGFGSSHRLEQCCLWFAALHFHLIENAEVPQSHHRLLGNLCQIHPRDAFKALLPPCFRLFLTFSCCLYDSRNKK